MKKVFFIFLMIICYGLNSIAQQTTKAPVSRPKIGLVLGGGGAKGAAAVGVLKEIE
ncbi:MAG: patatin-like phospholipase family protein, partial [Prevotella sp.]|nr:patatin-like phospholipase family protein [Prevotella sp.]